MKNKIKEKMLKGENTLGTFHVIGSAAAVECLGYAGLDYVVVDSEHGPFDVESAQTYIRAAKLAGITPLVRVKDGQRNSILKMLDVGAMGLIIPNVQSVEDVKKIIKYGKYYPIGERGIAPTSGSSFWYTDYASQGLDHYFEVSNSETLIIPQCETLDCLENIEEIVGLNGVDGIFVGPFDLSTALGKPGQFEDTEVKDAIQKIIDACKKAGKFAFIFAGSEPDIQKNFEMGFDSVAYSMDAIVLTEAIKKIIANAKYKK
ncbi:HpcH/HpaI aldolase family protein [Neobacillus sp. SAB-20_R2A]|uniref:HpcH/HpaI aldolase family protein n=1 Tax=Neobacillus sp. SAB-20_R2A TaxID=3120519 RepID=UPI003C6DD643